MKKLIVIATLIAALIVAANAAADRKGAVKVDILEKGKGTEVGWVIFNTTASGKIIAAIHLDDGIPNTEFWVGLRVWYPQPKGGDELQVEGELTTNEQGNGNTRLEMELPEDISDPVKAEVKLTGPSTYSSPFKWTDVPLKKSQKAPPAFNSSPEAITTWARIKAR